MLDVYLERIKTSEEYGTFGALLIEFTAPFATLEPPWRNNQPWNGDHNEVSCIPLGNYICKKVDHRRFGETFEVCDVPNRTGILFHVGNYRIDTVGCILPGQMWGKVLILDSQIAMERFRRVLKSTNEFRLIVQGDPDTYGYAKPKN